MVREYVLVAGGGKFGIQAGTYFESRGVVPVYLDRDRQCEASGKATILGSLSAGGQRQPVDWGDLDGPSLILDDAGSFLAELGLSLDPAPTHLVPAVPVNLMATAFKEVASGSGLETPPGCAHLPGLLSCVEQAGPYWTDCNEANGIALLSFAPPGKTCPPNCPGSLDFCPHRGKTEREPLYATIRACAPTPTGLGPNPVKTFVFESEQLAPGVGGIRWDDVVHFLEWCREWCRALSTHALGDVLGGFGGAVLVGTACNCHGVVNELEPRMRRTKTTKNLF
ncbi:MAG: hypothetical protein ACTSU5_22390 [Promethearchaeota archaeon]